jgi:hypothetical protein
MRGDGGDWHGHGDGGLRRQDRDGSMKSAEIPADVISTLRSGIS